MVWTPKAWYTYKGDSYFFTYEKSGKVKELEANQHFCRNFKGKGRLYISVSGKAKLIRDKDAIFLIRTTS